MVPAWRVSALASLADGPPPDGASLRARADVARRLRTDLEYLTPADLVDKARGLLPLVQETFTVAVAAGGWPAAGGDAGPAAGNALWSLSRVVAGSDDLKLYFDGGVPGILERLDGSPSSDAKAFLDSFDTLLYDHGCRGPGQWDIAGAVWETHPNLALTHLDQLRLLPDGAAPAAPTPGDAAADHAATAVLKVVNEIRVALREVGRQIADAHHIADRALLMMLTADELDDFTAHPETYGLKLSERSLRHPTTGV
jgi:pyruvate,water dikinase